MRSFWRVASPPNAIWLHLVCILPPGGCVGGGNDLKVVARGVVGGYFHAHVKAHSASLPALGVAFHARGTVKPKNTHSDANASASTCEHDCASGGLAVGSGCVLPFAIVVIGVNKGDPKFGRERFIFFLPYVVLFPRVDVGVVKENRNIEP